jgi:hypothetical protein
MHKIVDVVGILVVAVFVIACALFGSPLTTKTELPVTSPYEIMLQQGDSLPFRYWDEPF